MYIELFNNNLYDTDHIYPQSKTADDSLDNRVLVCKEDNHNKSDVYPLTIKIQERMRDTWRSIKAERELQREQNKYFYKGKRFLSWFLDIHPISFVLI